MARDDDRELITSERLPDLARQAALTYSGGELAIGDRSTRRDPTRSLVHPAIELRNALHIERNGGKIARLPAQERSDGVDRTAHIRRRRRFPRMRVSPRQTRAGFRLARLRQLHPRNAAGAPCDAASADIRVEQRKALGRHGVTNLVSAVAACASVLARYFPARRRAPRTPRASSATRLITTVTVFAVALSSPSRLPLSAFTSAEPTTTPSAPDAIIDACSALRTPKPTATGKLVWRLMRATAAATFPGSGVAVPVMPVMDT